MKRVITLFTMALFAGISYGADLEVAIVNSDLDMSNGEIDLTLNGGVAPFVYSWTGPGGFTSSEEDLTGLEAGTYTVTVTDAYCGTATLEVVLENNPVNSIEEAPKFELSLYPNPTSGWLYFKSNEVLDVKVYNVAGKLIFQQRNATQIDLGHHPAGLYMVEVSSAKGIITKKVTVQ